MQNPQLKGFVGMLFEYVDTCTFFEMRLMCKMFWKESFNNQTHWYKWLRCHGKTSGWELIDHYKHGEYYKNISYKRIYMDCSTYDCTDKTHYRMCLAKPVLLKTVLLPMQVFQTAVRKKQKRLQRELDKARGKKDEAEVNLLYWREQHEYYVERLSVSTKDELELKSNRASRKRARITLHISKQQ